MKNTERNGWGPPGPYTWTQQNSREQHHPFEEGKPASEPQFPFLLNEYHLLSGLLPALSLSHCSLFFLSGVQVVPSKWLLFFLTPCPHFFVIFGGGWCKLKLFWRLSPLISVTLRVRCSEEKSRSSRREVAIPLYSKPRECGFLPLNFSTVQGQEALVIQSGRYKIEPGFRGWWEEKKLSEGGRDRCEIRVDRGQGDSGILVVLRN